MKIRLYDYLHPGVPLLIAKLEIEGTEYLSYDVRNYGSSIEIVVGGRDRANKLNVGVCESDVNRGVAKAIDIDVEPTKKDWGRDLKYTTIPFDPKLLGN